jgi:hypothetical protein
MATIVSDDGGVDDDGITLSHVPPPLIPMVNEELGSPVIDTICEAGLKLPETAVNATLPGLAAWSGFQLK